MELLFTLCLVAILSTSTEAQNIPASYTYSTTDIVSVNGSSATGHCLSVITNICDGTTTCTEPSSSVLFDGHIPTLTGLDGDMWASRLLKLQPTAGMAAKIKFDFSNNPNFRLERLEVVMFNCPQRGTAVQTIRLADTTTDIGIISSTITSCDSLVKVCIPAACNDPRITLQFISQSVYLAELRFCSNGGATCPQDAIIITPPASTTSTDGESQTSTAPNTSTSGESVPTTASFSITCTQCEVCVCTSCSTSTILASVITAILTALLTTAVLVLVQIAVWKYRPHSTPHGGAETGTPAGGEWHEYELVEWGEGGVAASNHTHRVGRPLN